MISSEDYILPRDLHCPGTDRWEPISVWSLVQKLYPGRWSIDK